MKKHGADVTAEACPGKNKEETMNQELVLEYSEKQELRGTLEDFQGMSGVQEPGCGDGTE